MLISKDVEKPQQKVEPAFMVKTLKKLEIQVSHFNIRKVTCDKPSTSI